MYIVEHKPNNYAVEVKKGAKMLIKLAVLQYSFVV